MIKGLFADGLFSPVLKGLFDTSILTRYFTTFDSVANTQIDLSSAITLTGDFEIEFKFVYSLQANKAILGGGASTHELRFDSSSGRFRLIASGAFTNLAITTANYNDGVFYTATLSRSGSTVELNVNGDTVSATNANSFEISHVGQNGSGAGYFDGVISDVKIWDGGDRDTGTLVLDMPIDAQYGTDTSVTDESGNNSGTAVNFVDADSEFFTEQSDGDWLGDELVVNGGFDTDTDWTKGAGWTISGGAGVADGTGSGAALYQTAGLEIGFSYLSSYEVVSFSSGEVRLEYSSTENTGYKSVLGTFSEIVTPTTSTSSRPALRSNLFNGSVDNISFKRILELP